MALEPFESRFQMTGFPIVFQINKEKNLEMEFSPKGMELSYFQA